MATQLYLHFFLFFLQVFWYLLGNPMIIIISEQIDLCLKMTQVRLDHDEKIFLRNCLIRLFTRASCCFSRLRNGS